MLMKVLPLFALLAAPALAETQDDILSAQIRTGWQTKSGGHMAALEMELSPGWKTYWRAPGDAGIPPVFDWSGSENLRSVRVHWPSPVVFHTNGMQTIGYHDAVVLPLEVVARDPSRPVKLRAEVSMGVCKDICMPASLSLSATLDGKGAPDPAITRALDARPQTAAEAGLRAISCDVAPISDGLRLTARIGLPERGGQEVVVVETTDPSVWVAEAESARQGRTLTAVTDLVPGAGAPFALDRAGLTVTVLGDGGRAVEIKGCPAP
jgi:DsbC/DsbD-like thiol-disulfide interchange protein